CPQFTRFADIDSRIIFVACRPVCSFGPGILSGGLWNLGEELLVAQEVLHFTDIDEQAHELRVRGKSLRHGDEFGAVVDQRAAAVAGISRKLRFDYASLEHACGRAQPDLPSL